MTERALEIVSIDIDGMTCASCVNRIERFVNRVDGVEEVSVNLATERARVAFDASRSNLGLLRDAVRAAGYDVREPAAEAATAPAAARMPATSSARGRSPTCAESRW